MKVRYQLEVTAILTRSGDYNRNDNFPQLRETAKDDIRHVQVFIKQGGREPEPVPAKIKVLQVILEPESGDS